MRESVRGAVQDVKSEFTRAAQSGATAQDKVSNIKHVVEKYRELAIKHRPVILGKPVATMEAVASYIHGEMMANLNSGEFKSLRKMRTGATNNPAFDRLPALAAADGINAHIDLTSLVNYGKKWDHKSAIRNGYGSWSCDATAKVLYSFDIWSNIHFGYIGYHSGFSALELGGERLWQMLSRTASSRCCSNMAGWTTLPIRLRFRSA
jgi:hypothetical protein